MIYPFRQGKFPFYTRVCNFANYRLPFSRFLIRVLQFFRVHISQVNQFGLSRISHFEISCRAQDRRPDLDVFRYFYEFITAEDWYTFAHRKDQSLSFDLGEDFVFDKELARALIEHKSPICPLHEHFLLLGRLCFSWSQGDRVWPVIRRKRDRVIMCLRDALKVLNFDVFHFDLEDQGDDEVPLMKQVAIEATSSVPTPGKDAAGSSGSQVGKKSVFYDVEIDPEIRSLDKALQYHPSSGSLKSKGVMPEVAPQALIRKRKTELVQIRPFDPLPMPRTKKVKNGSSHSGCDVMIELDEHLTGGKSSREEAALARSKPTPAFSGGFLPVNEVEGMEIENPEVTSKGSGKTPGEHKVVTFSGTTLGSSLGPDCFISEEEDQVSSLPPSWFGPELMSFFRYADVFSDDMEIEPTTAEDKFVPDWDIRNKDSVMDELVARTLLFNINTPIDHARSRKMKSQDLGAAVLTNQAQSNVFVTELYRRWVEAESVRENLEKDNQSLKRKIQKTPEAEKKIAQLTLEL
ncbi:hypothetical protein Hanom_Chr14g01254311 [Helianthus anomalus]